MKRLLGVLMALAMLTMGHMAMAESAGEPMVLAENAAKKMDLDGDGAEETIGWTMVAENEYDSFLTLSIISANGETLRYKTDIQRGSVWVADLDEDGRFEILPTGDVMSDDYFTRCLRYENGALCELLFADANRGENTDGYYEDGYGYIDEIAGNTVTLTGSQDVLGTWMASRVFTLTPNGRFELNDGGVWTRQVDVNDENVWTYGALTLKQPISYFNDDGNAAGTLESGEQILITASNKLDTAWFATRDGRTGALSIEPNAGRGWGYRVNGVSETELFEYVPYAD